MTIYNSNIGSLLQFLLQSRRTIGQSASKSIKLFLLGSLVSSLAVTGSQGATFAESDFELSHWEITQLKGPVGGQTVTRVSEGGASGTPNDGFLQVVTNPPQLDVITGIFFRPAFSWLPSIQPIESLSFLVDVKNFEAVNQGQGFELGLKQANATYMARFVTNSTLDTFEWHTRSADNLTLTSFERISPDGFLNFSESGAPIEFGLLTSNSTSRTIIAGYDNFRVTVNAFDRGDFDNSRQNDAADIDLLTKAVSDRSFSARLDLNDDKIVDSLDREEWVLRIANTYFGDSTLDGEFNSGDLTSVFQRGEYEDTFANNSTWADGDWNGDGDVDSSDLIQAFQGGGYERGPKLVLLAVPEPSGFLTATLAASALVTLCNVRRRESA